MRSRKVKLIGFRLISSLLVVLFVLSTLPFAALGEGSTNTAAQGIEVDDPGAGATESTPTHEPTKTPEPTVTPDPPPTPEPSHTPEPSDAPETSPSASPSATPSASPSATPEPTHTPTPSVLPEPSHTPSPTVKPTDAAVHTLVPDPTATPTPRTTTPSGEPHPSVGPVLPHVSPLSPPPASAPPSHYPSPDGGAGEETTVTPSDPPAAEPGEEEVSPEPEEEPAPVEVGQLCIEFVLRDLQGEMARADDTMEFPIVIASTDGSGNTYNVLGRSGSVVRLDGLPVGRYTVSSMKLPSGYQIVSLSMEGFTSTSCDVNIQSQSSVTLCAQYQERKVGGFSKLLSASLYYGPFRT